MVFCVQNYAQNRSITVSLCHSLSTRTSVNMGYRALSDLITNEMLYQLSYVGLRDVMIIEDSNLLVMLKTLIFKE